MKTFDAAIAGGGLIGCAIALELSRGGLQVALFDARDPGHEASWASAGILSPAPENSAMEVPIAPTTFSVATPYRCANRFTSGLYP